MKTTAIIAARERANRIFSNGSTSGSTLALAKNVLELTDELLSITEAHIDDYGTVWDGAPGAASSSPIADIVQNERTDSSRWVWIENP